MPKPFRILLTSQFGRLTGGGQQSLRLLFENLDRNKYELFLLAGEKGEFVEQVQSMGHVVQVITLPSIKIRHSFSIWRAYSTLKKFFIHHQIDLIHTDSSRMTLYLGRLAKIKKIPLIQHVRVSTAEPQFYEKILYDLSLQLIAVSQAAARRFDKWDKDINKVHVIHNAVDIEKFQTAAHTSRLRQQWHLKEDDIVIGLVGQMAPVKRQEDLIHAADLLLKKYPQARIVLIGDGQPDYQVKLKRLVAQLKLKPFIQFRSFENDNVAIIKSLDILVNASDLEGFSRVIIEAMAAAKPVVATRVGGNVEAVRDGVTGYLVDVRSPKKLADALMRLLQDPDLRQTMGQRGLQTVMDHFSLNQQIAAIESVYDQLLQPSLGG